MRHLFLRPWIVGVVVGLGAIVTTPTLSSASPTPSVLAQASQDSSGSSRISGRGMRGIIKLGIGAVVAVVAGVGWLINKSKQKSQPPTA
jgi:hypothetical protein